MTREGGNQPQALLCKPWRNTSLCIFSQAFYEIMKKSEEINQCHFSQRQKIVIAIEIMVCELEFSSCFKTALL